MKKFLRYTLLLVFIVGVSALIAVGGFYLHDNKNLVVSWLNNEYLVTEKDYKELVISSNKTISELNEKINNLKVSNEEMTLEITSLQLEIETMTEENVEEKAELTSRIVTLEETIVENEKTIIQLTDLIQSLRSDLIDRLIDLPDNAEKATMTTYVFDNNFFVTITGFGSYYFDYEAGIFSKFMDSSSVKSISLYNGIYFIQYNTSYLGCYFPEENSFVVLDSVSGFTRISFVEDIEGLYVFGNLYIGYFDYSTNEFSRLYDFKSNGSGQTDSQFVFDNYIFNLRGQEGEIVVINRETKSFTSLGSYGFQSNYGSYVYELMGNIYLYINARTDTYPTLEAGIYLFDKETVSISLVEEFDFSSKAKSENAYYVFDDCVVFSNLKIFYCFDGITVSIITDDTSVYNSSKYSYLIYEDDFVRYFKLQNSYYIFCYDKVNKSFDYKWVVNSNIYGSYKLNDSTVMVLFGSKVYLLNIDTFEISSYASIFCEYVNYVIDLEDYILFLNNSSAYSYSSYLICKDDLSYRALTDVGIYNSYIRNGNNLLIYGDSYFSIVDLEGSTSVGHLYNSKLSSVYDKEFYVLVNDLADGSLYYKYVFNEDLTYTKDLVIVK